MAKDYVMPYFVKNHDRKYKLYKGDTVLFAKQDVKIEVEETGTYRVMVTPTYFVFTKNTRGKSAKPGKSTKPSKSVRPKKSLKK